MADKSFDFRPRTIASQITSDLAPAQQPDDENVVNVAREIHPFTMGKLDLADTVVTPAGDTKSMDFRPSRVEEEPDPKGLSVPASAPSSTLPTSTEPGSSALQKQIASAEKVSTLRKENESSTPAS